MAKKSKNVLEKALDKTIAITEKKKKERTDTSINGASRNDLMEAVKRLGIKNFRVMNKSELKEICEGAKPDRIEAIQKEAVERWKAGWKKK